MGPLWIYIFGVGCLFSKPLKAFGADFQTVHNITTYQGALETCRTQYNGSVALPRDGGENYRLMKVLTGQGSSTVWLGATLTLFPWRFRQGQETEYKPLENQGCFRSSNFITKWEMPVALTADYESTFTSCKIACWKTFLSVYTHLNDNGRVSLSCSCSEELDGGATSVSEELCPYPCPTKWYPGLWCSEYAENGSSPARVYAADDGWPYEFADQGCYSSRQTSIPEYSSYLYFESALSEMHYEQCIELCIANQSGILFAGIGATLRYGKFAIVCSCSASLQQSFQTNYTFCPSLENMDMWNFTTIDVYRVYHTHGFKQVKDRPIYQFFDNGNAQTCGYFSRFISGDGQTLYSIVAKTKCADRLPVSCVSGSVLIERSSTKLSWFEAKEFCHGRERSLPTIYEAYRTNLKWRGPFWVALVGRTWKDHRGSELSFTRWSEDATHDVGNRCLYMDTITGKWRDDDCQSQHAVVCEGTNLGTTGQPSVVGTIPTSSTQSVTTVGPDFTADTGTSSVQSSEQDGGGIFESWKVLTGTIVGVIVMVVFAVVAIVLVVLFMKRKRNRKRCPENAAPSGLDNRTYDEVQLSTISGSGPVINNMRDDNDDGGSEPTYYNTRDTCMVPCNKPSMADTATGKRAPKDNGIGGETKGPRAGQRLTEPEQLPIYAVPNKPKYHKNNSQSENLSYESDEDEVTLVENDTYVENTRTGCTKKGENGAVLTRLEEKPKNDALGSNSGPSRPALEDKHKVSHEEVIYDQNKGDGEYFENVSDWLKTKSDNQ